MATAAPRSWPLEPRRATLAPALKSACLSCSCSSSSGPLGGLQWIGERAELTWPFPVNERTMPHIHDMVGQLFEPSRRTGRC